MHRPIQTNNFFPNHSHMETLLVLLSLYASFSFADGSASTEFISPNFSASPLQFVDQSGVFLSSKGSSFDLGLFSHGSASEFHLSVVHAASSVTVWTANRDSPISNIGKVSLTPKGLVVSDQSNAAKWQTPFLSGNVHTMRLSESGNLELLDILNRTLWDSFSHPTDTIVPGQTLKVGSFLSSSASKTSPATGDYRLVVTSTDTILLWYNLTYWKLSMSSRAYVNSNHNVEYLSLNSSGLYLLNGSTVVLKIVLRPASFRYAKLLPSGQFVVSSVSGSLEITELNGPRSLCRIPSYCGQLGLCTETSLNSPTCSCPAGFSEQANPGSCLPGNRSSLIGPSYSNSTEVEYLSLGNSVDYFAFDFSPLAQILNQQACEDSCTANSSCLGYFYNNSSSLCYPLTDRLGSIISSSSGGLMGFVKASSQPSTRSEKRSNHKLGFPVIAVVLLPFIGLSLIFVVCFLLWRRRATRRQMKLNDSLSFSSDDSNAYYIPGLPKRYGYSELLHATENFKHKIGSGGFGSVYLATLSDKSVVAVKKLTNVGVQGNKEFCTEIAVIGKIHHINLVKLRGFCAQGQHRLLVYEYMNRGSLDKTLFSVGPVLEWQERVDIALGTARGLAYLHNGCDHKVIHCDVKPENILLHGQFHAKISDFGLSKLLTQEQSSLFTTMRGTRGYLAPEWLTNSAISEKADVYSFGMVLLELVSGRKNCSTRSQEQSKNDTESNGRESASSVGSRPVYFPLLALEMHEEKRYLELADARLEGRVTGVEVEKVVRVALCCVHEDPALRPTMACVVGMLEGGVSLGVPRVESLNFLRFYGQRFAEASMVVGENRDSGGVRAHGGSSDTSVSRDSNVLFSYMSSQQISGPR